MKKVFSVILLCAAVLSAGAQNNTRIGSAHAVNFGVGYGYASAPIANTASVFMDINAQKSNFVTRIGAGLDNVGPLCYSGNLDFLYLCTLTDGLYLYPFAGAKFEYHDAPEMWDAKTALAPQAGLGLEYQFNKNIGIFAQGNYEYAIKGDGHRAVGMAGLVFAFGPGSRKAYSVSSSEAEAAIRNAAARANAAEDEAAAKLAAQQKAADEAAAKAEAIRKEAEAAARARQAAANAPKTYASFDPSSSVKVNFPINSSFVDEEYRNNIESVAAYLAKNPAKKAVIKTYADKNTGSDETNKVLSEKRAAAVKYYLTQAGLDASRIDIQALGSSVNPYATPEENRTAVITVE